MKYFYDTEFLENGRTIELISIGIVAEDGREYYAVSAALPARKIRQEPWLMENVVPGLPHGWGDERNHLPSSWLINYKDPCVKPPQRIAHEVEDFLLAHGDPELWADYAAYDHVVLCQLFGRMIDLPIGMPMYTNDLQQLINGANLQSYPDQEFGHHNALEDARHLKRAYEFAISR